MKRMIGLGVFVMIGGIGFGSMTGKPTAAVIADETSALQTRIDAASASGGGRVSVAPGRHVVGTIFLRDGVELHLERGCTLEGTTNLTEYAPLKLEYSEMPRPWHALVAAIDAKNVSVTGEGEVFGNGTRFKVGLATLNRPRGFIFFRCRNVRITDVKLRDAASWGCYFKECDGVTVERMTIDNHASINNDGIDIESKNVVIADCDIDSGDDGVCLKSDNPNFTVENVEVKGCVVRSNCSALKFGTASHGTCRHVRFHDCTVDACRRGTINPKTGKEMFIPNHLSLFPGSIPGFFSLAAIVVDNVDGGTVEDIVFERINVKATLVPVFIRAGSRFHRRFAGVDCEIPYGESRIFRNIVIRDLKAVSMGATASSVTGVELCRPKDILFENCEISCLAAGELADAAKTCPVPEKIEAYPDPYIFDGILPAYGCYVRHADGVTFRNVRFEVRNGDDSREPIVSEDASVVCR